MVHLFTTDCALPYYNTYLNFYFPPFSIWLEDIYIGFLAQKLNTPLEAITDKYFRWNEGLDVTHDNVKPLLDIGVNNILFIYDYGHVNQFWSIIEK